MVASNLWVCIAGVMSAASLAARAQWSVQVLHPAGSSSSVAYGVDADSAVGVMTVDGTPHAALWTDIAVVDLGPAAASGASYAFGVSGGRQVGYTWAQGSGRASLWSSTAASWVDLTPAPSVDANAVAIDGAVQVGRAMIGGSSRAGLWRGSAESWVSLAPPDSLESAALAAAGEVQVGWARILGQGFVHASLWRGDAASWTSLMPAGATWSIAYAACEGRQGGAAAIGGVFHAGVWRGSAASWVDLSVPGAAESYIYGVTTGYAAGWAQVGGAASAILWSGELGAYTNLHGLLPAGYAWSKARAVREDAAAVRVVGEAYRSAAGRTEAVLWALRLCDGPRVLEGPRSAKVCRGAEVRLSTTAEGAGPLAYRWRLNGGDIDPAVNPTAAQPTLVIAHAAAADAGVYDCVVLGCGEPAVSPAASLGVCLADFGCDGFVDFFDYAAFVEAFESGDPAADANADGFLDFFDYADFVASFETGC